MSHLLGLFRWLSLPFCLRCSWTHYYYYCVLPHPMLSSSGCWQWAAHAHCWGLGESFQDTTEHHQISSPYHAARCQLCFISLAVLLCHQRAMGLSPFEKVTSSLRNEKKLHCHPILLLFSTRSISSLASDKRGFFPLPNLLFFSNFHFTEICQEMFCKSRMISPLLNAWNPLYSWSGFSSSTRIIQQWSFKMLRNKLKGNCHPM